MFNALNGDTPMLGVRLDEETEARLSSVAQAQGRTKSDIARTAIRLYVERNDAAFRAEAKRQALNAVARGWSEEDAHWESIAASNEADRPTAYAAE